MHELTTLHNAIEQALRTAMPQLAHVEAFALPDQTVPVPAALFALASMRSTTDNGSGKTAIEARFRARLLVDASGERASLQAAILAAQLSELLDAQNWGLEFVEAARDVWAWPDTATPARDTYTVWAVDWGHTLYIGQLAEWTDESQRILFNIEPASSTGSPEQYDPASEAAQGVSP